MPLVPPGNDQEGPPGPAEQLVCEHGEGGTTEHTSTERERAVTGIPYMPAALHELLKGERGQRPRSVETQAILACGHVVNGHSKLTFRRMGVYSRYRKSHVATLNPLELYRTSVISKPKASSRLLCCTVQLYTITPHRIRIYISYLKKSIIANRKSQCY